MIHLILTLAILGCIAWLIQTYIPMPQPFKVIINVIIVLFVIMMLFNFAGIGHFNLGGL